MIRLETDNTMHPDRLLECNPQTGLPLYILGELKKEDAHGVAVVGTRKPTLYGIKMAEKIAQTAVMNGKTVVSGLARGIDTESHRGALISGGRTLAVLGTGLDRIYPEENVGLAEEIKNSGALLSQFEPGTPPLKRNFPIRNALVAKLCSVLVVVQATERSGSLITARLAREFGKKVFVVAGEIDDPLFAGNYAFLKKHEKDRGVELLYDLERLNEFLGNKAVPRKITDFDDLEKIQLESDEEKVFKVIRNVSEGVFFDDIAELTGYSCAQLPALLLTLMMKDLIFEDTGKVYKLNRG